MSTPNVDVAIKLFQLGWKLFPTLADTLAKITPEQLELLKSLYAAFHALASTSDVGDHLQEPRFCAQPDIMQANAQVCKWPTKNVTWSVLATPPGLEQQAVVEAYTEAFSRWKAVCGINPQYQPGNGQAMIVMGIRAIDGSFGVLAESELPCGNARQCRQWYDSGEQWAIFDGKGPGGRKIDITRVATHELGHAFGMDHIGTGNLLAPVYSESIWTPQAGDIQQMQGRYGPPASIPDPPPPPPAGGSAYTLRMSKDGVLTIDGYRLTKLFERQAA